ncbi:MAG: hypothetical protein A3G83_00775 [Betaproteobacteria bacterium RIFCSPLOWO2_12_FULL_68_20]|nr:MAG: hypothetical protein A3G83_00775 [Betaproteobacteria bacterium RIFCSPLOWO2_12_FULL_68_20]
MLLERLLTLAEAAEKAAMEATVSRLQAALYAKTALLALRGEYAAIDALANQSPFLIVAAKASNYLGEFDGLPPEGVEGGNWLFDRVRAELVYVPNLTRFLSGGSDDPVPAIRFRIEVRKTTRHAYVGVGLTPVNGYRWEPGT